MSQTRIKKLGTLPGCRQIADNRVLIGDKNINQIEKREVLSDEMCC